MDDGKNGGGNSGGNYYYGRNEKENTQQPAYRLNERLFPVKLEDPPLPSNEAWGAEYQRFVRVSLPSGNFEPDIKTPICGRDTFNPGASGGLATHCLRGYEMARPTMKREPKEGIGLMQHVQNERPLHPGAWPKGLKAPRNGGGRA